MPLEFDLLNGSDGFDTKLDMILRDMFSLVWNSNDAF